MNESKSKRISKPKLVILSGAGISAESGLKTFRDSNGLWEGHDVMSVASPQGWLDNRELVLNFYNQRRMQLKAVEANSAHHKLVELEKIFDVVIITQNVDDLHERAGSKKVIHLHGELRKVRSESNERLIYAWSEDLTAQDKAEDGSTLRPHIVWFGEAVPKMEEAAEEIANADAVVIIGTSMQVYPAASLYAYAPPTAQIFYLDPYASQNINDLNIICIDKTAVNGIDTLCDLLKEKLKSG